MSPAYTEGITVVDTDALPAPILSHAEPPIAPIHRMLRYAVQKFLARIHMERVVIGISGGIDSAVAAALYVDAIGAENVLLVNMPSRFNSATTKGLAAQLADNLGSRHMIVPIEESVSYTAKQLSEIPIEGAAAAPGEHLPALPATGTRRRPPSAMRLSTATSQAFSVRSPIFGNIRSMTLRAT